MEMGRQRGLGSGEMDGKRDKDGQIEGKHHQHLLPLLQLTGHSYPLNLGFPPPI